MLLAAPIVHTISPQIDEHIAHVRRVRQQQDHLLRLMDVAEKVKEQDRCIRRFCEMQRDFMQHMQPSVRACVCVHACVCSERERERESVCVCERESE